MPSHKILETVFCKGPVFGMAAGWFVLILLMSAWWVIKKLDSIMGGGLSARLQAFKHLDWLQFLIMFLPIGLLTALYDYGAIKPFTLPLLMISVLGIMPSTFLIVGMSGEDHSTEPPTTLPDRQILAMFMGPPVGALLGGLYLMVFGG